MENMEIYEKVRSVPDNAKKQIQAGRLRGMTDINPVWRIKVLTETFGPCGIGWKYIVKSQRLEPGANNEIAAFVDIDLYYKVGEEWSEAIPGTGGSSFVAKEKNGMYTSDECFKMALTDALSVACKSLGVGADVYWAAGRSKYSNNQPDNTPPPSPPFTQQAQPNNKPGIRIPPKDDPPVWCSDCRKKIPDYFDGKALIKAADIAKRNEERYGAPLCQACAQRAAK